MTAGTHGFIGGRLKQAREARGLTTAALADMVGVTRSAISLYETGYATPQLEVFAKISSKLNMPVLFFLKPLREQTQPETLFFRSMASTTKTARAAAQIRYHWLVEEIIPFIRQYVRYPDPNVVTFDDPTSALTESRIEEIAKAMRRFWGLGDGPISDVTLLLENNGIVVSKMEISEPTLDAFSAWSTIDKRPYIIASIEKPSAVRWRFNVSHELAHLVIHKCVDRKSLMNSRDFKLIEQQAHLLAGAFLLPAETFARDVYTPTLDTLLGLKPKWRVAISAMINRMVTLEIIGEDQAKRLWINMNRRKWRLEEPLDDAIQFEQPRLLRKALEMIADQVTTPEQIQEQIKLSPREIEGLTNLPPGFFKEPVPPVILKEIPSSQSVSVIDLAESVVKNYIEGDNS